MLKWIVVVLLIAAVMLGVWRLKDGGQAPGLGAEGGTASTPALSPGEATLVDGPRGGGPQGSGENGGPVGARSVIPADERAQAAAAAEGGELVVQTLHPGNKQPLTDLDVWVLDRDSQPAVEWQMAFQEEETRLAYLRTHGVQYTTDDKGEASIPKFSSCALLAEGKGHRGETSWAGPKQGPILLAMRPKVDLVVRVLDSEDRMVTGAPVAIIDDMLVRPRLRVMRPTTTNGEAIFSGLAEVLPKQNDGIGYSIVLNFPQANPQRVSLDPSAFPEEPVELRMPPAAPMRIVVVGPDGEPVKEPTTIALGKSGPDRGGLRSGTRAGFEVQVQQRTSSGATRFAWIEVNASMEVLVTGSGNRADQVFQVVGPPVPEELYELELVWDAKQPTLVGRAVGPDGQPVVKRHGRLRLTEGRIPKATMGFVTDEVGGFELRIDEVWTPGAVRMGNLTMSQMEDRGPLEADLDLSFEVPPGETDLGAVQFRGLPMIAAGRVLDPDGEPMAGAHAVVQYRKAGGDNQNWQNLDGAADTTGKDGFFQVYGESPAKDLRISVRRRGFEGGQTNFELGDEDVLVTLTQRGLDEEDEEAGK